MGRRFEGSAPGGGGGSQSFHLGRGGSCNRHFAAYKPTYFLAKASQREKEGHTSFVGKKAASVLFASMMPT